MAGGDPAGGSAGLAKLIDQYGESLHWDFQHYLTLDLLDVVREYPNHLSPRKALAFARCLPVDSATAAEMRGGAHFRGWDADRYLLANLVDSVRENTHAFVSANSKSTPKTPDPMPRPEDQGKKNTDSKGNAFRAMAASHFAKARQAKGG